MSKSKIQVTITSNELCKKTKEEMWQLYERYYNYSREYFMERIHSNNYFSFYTINDNIVGFTGLRINRTDVCDRECLLIYFGQTIIDKAHRGKSLIPRTATKLLLKYWKDLVLGRIYVWADSLTYKAYLVFAKNVGEYYPSYQAVTPKLIKGLLDFVGDEYYGSNYCPQTGTVKKDTVFVKDPGMMINLSTEKDPDILFYAITNPKYVQGHGMHTITPMHVLNYLTLLMKCLKKFISGRKNNPCMIDNLEPVPNATSSRISLKNGILKLEKTPSKNR